MRFKMIFVLLALIVMAVCMLTACGKDTKESNDKKEPTKALTEAPEPTKAPEVTNEVISTEEDQWLVKVLGGSLAK